MYDVGEKLYFSVFFYDDLGAVSAEVVSCEVDQHHMLTVFFRIGSQARCSGTVLGVVPGPLKSPGNGVDLCFSVFYHKLGFGRAPKYFKISVIKKEEVWGGVYRPERSINVEFVTREFLRKTPGQYQLKDIPTVAVGFGFMDQIDEFFIGKVRSFVSLFLKGIDRIAVFIQDFFYLIQIIFSIEAVGKQMRFMVKKTDSNNVLIHRIINFR
ncbi:MAG: Uncharacterised protein [Flavobacteriaceae bacterium]|nr:MAG: Uncharacterised protein [Flavobacteriaceae bacterium]